MKKSLVVEFVGLPGVGKTTLAQRLASRLRSEGIEVSAQAPPQYGTGPWSKVIRTLSALAFASTHPNCCYEVHRMLSVTQQVSLRDYVTLILNWLMALRNTRKRLTAGSVQIIDQGLFQLAWSTGYSGRSTVAVDVAFRLACQFHRSDVIVIAKAPLDTVAHRLRSRPGMPSRLERHWHRDPSALHRAESLMRNLENHIMELPRKDPSVRVMTVYTTDHDVHDHLWTELLRILGMLEEAAMPESADV